MIEFKKPRPDIFCAREQTLDPIIKYCSKSTNNRGLKELQMEYLEDYNRISNFCYSISIQEPNEVLYDNTLVESRKWSLRKGILEGLLNKCKLNFILHEDLNEQVEFVYYERGLRQSVFVSKDSIDMFIHTLRLAKQEVKIYITTDSYVR